MPLFAILMIERRFIMAFKDLLNKGMYMINKGATAVKNAAMEKTQAMKDFEILITRSDHIGPMLPYVHNNTEPQPGKEQIILNACLTINVEKTKLVNSLIPVDENIVCVRTAKEAKTSMEYIFVITDKRIWILDQKEYITYEFSQIKNCEIVNKGIMTQGIKFDDKAFYIDGNETDVSEFIKIVTNPDERMGAMNRAQKYLCGIIPKKQYINMALKGVTIGINNEIVIHNKFDNKLISVQDITHVQILINDLVVLSKGKEDTSILANPMEARKISIKFIMTSGEYIVDILSESLMNTSYKKEDTTYIENYNFAKKIVDEIAVLLN